MFYSSFSALNFDTGDDADADGADNEVDGQYMQDVQFSKIKGRRFEAGRDFLDSTEMMVHFVTMCLALEPLRFLSGWLMRRAVALQGVCEHPAVFDIFHEQVSC